MKKMVKLLLVVSILFFFSIQAAVAKSYQSRAGEKMVSGLANVTTGFIELPKNVIISTQKNGLPYGMTIGFVSGVMHTIGRTVIGAFDFVTFMVPTEPSVSPPYIWKDFYSETTYGTHY